MRHCLKAQPLDSGRHGSKIQVYQLIVSWSWVSHLSALSLNRHLICMQGIRMTAAPSYLTIGTIWQLTTCSFLKLLSASDRQHYSLLISPLHLQPFLPSLLLEILALHLFRQCWEFFGVWLKCLYHLPLFLLLKLLHKFPWLQTAYTSPRLYLCTSSLPCSKSQAQVSSSLTAPFASF